jgi:hypothetical protein
MPTRTMFLGVVAIVAAIAGITAASGSAAHFAGKAGAATSYHHHCYGLYPGGLGGEYAISYAPGCYGHDETDIAPNQTTSGTASNITWTFYLPKDGGSMSLLDLGPTFWLGVQVADSHSLGAQAFQELQFYPDMSLASQASTPGSTSGCTPDGGFNVTKTVGKWGICSPTWAVNPSTYEEYAAFNGMVQKSGSPGTPFVMNSGDKIRVHIFKGSQSGNPVNVAVSDLTLGTSAAALVLNSGSYKSDHDGTLTTTAGANRATTNYLYWGGEQEPPMSLSWEIGHPNLFTYPLAPECVPGMFNCYSYNVTSGWQATTPLKIVGAHFTVGSTNYNPTSWTTVDTQGGSEEDILWCGVYNNSLSNGFCTFPWYSLVSGPAIAFGGQYSGTTNSYTKYNQWAKTPTCADTEYSTTFKYYCATTLQSGTPIGP